MRNLRLVLRYDGTDFQGWQTQPGFRTVQATLDSNGRPFLFAAPVLIGRSSEAASILVPASFDDAA